MDILKLDWVELKQTPVSAKARSKRWPGTKTAQTMMKNAENYCEWVVAKIKKVCGETPKNCKPSALCIYMTPNRIEQLHQSLSPMDFLNYAPRELNDITDDEFGLDVKEAFERDERR